MATKCSIDAVQHKTSHEVQMSQSSGPKIQPWLIFDMHANIIITISVICRHLYFKCVYIKKGFFLFIEENED